MSTAAETEPGEEKTQVLLVEYQAAQAHVDILNREIWQVGAIFLGAALVGGSALAAVAATRESAILISAAAVGIGSLLEMSQRITLRHQVSASNVFRRMRAIEQDLGMRRCIYMEILRHGDLTASPLYLGLLSADEQQLLRSDYAKLPWPSAKRVARAMAYVVYVLLGLLVAGKWVDAYL